VNHEKNHDLSTENLPVGAACLAGLITFLVFLRALSCGFVNMDDPDYVLNNTLIGSLDPAHISAAFSTIHAGFWMPLTWISLAVDHHFWGMNPLGYHLTNILLHAINTGLVVVIADRLMKGRRTMRGVERLLRGERQELMGGEESSTLCGSSQPPSHQIYPVILLLAGLLWGIHPLRVESVAWVTERKDVLNGLFLLGSIHCYLRYTQGCRTSADHFWLRRDYALCFILFMLSLMAKPVSVVMPFLLLVIDWYPLHRLHRSNLRQIVAEKAPFLLCSGVTVAATLFFASHSNILTPYDNLTFSQRLAISGNGVFEYCRFMLYPAGILPLHVIDASQMTLYALRGVAFVVFSVVLIYVFRKERWPAAVLFGFLLPLLPVLAFFQNGLQAFASRFTYLPSLSPTILLTFLAVSVFEKNGGFGLRFLRQTVLIGGVLLVGAYGVTSWNFIGTWKSTETLWSRIIDLQPTGRAFKERGLYYLSRGMNAEAGRDLAASINFARKADLEEIYKLHALRGVALFKQDLYAEAVHEFDRAISSCSDPKYFFYRGMALMALGRTKEAEADFSQAGGATGPIEWGNSLCRKQ